MCRRRVGTEAQGIATPFESIVESPAVRASVDEQLEVQTFAVAQALASVSRSDRHDRCVGGNEVPGNGRNFQLRYSRFWSYCQSSCNVISEPAGLQRTESDKKKALER